VPLAGVGRGLVRERRGAERGWRRRHGNVVMKPIYIAAYHQSKFGKLMGMKVPEILDNAIQGACRQIGAPASSLDVASVGAACNVSLNEQGLLAGLVAMTPVMAAKPIEAVEN